jgi:urease accessory protein
MTNLATLLTLSDSRLPTGGHVHSGGIEEAVTEGLVRDLVTLRAFLCRRIRTTGLVTASVASAVHSGSLTVTHADHEIDARTPAPAARKASRAQGRGLLRLARRVWPAESWEALGMTPVVYTTMAGSATAAQRLLALDPGDVAALTFELATLCEATSASACKELADLSDPLLDVLAQRHSQRERPLFAS